MAGGNMEQQKTWSSFDSVQGMLAPWGFDSMMNGDVDAHLKRLQSAAAEIQEACVEAINRQIASVTAANQTFAQLLEKAPQIHQPKDAIAQVSNLMAAFAESASEQSKTWANLAQRIQDTCVRTVRETTEELQK
jgi:hypothetical protein